ncbi:MAG: hypothetical protein HC906_06600 [Bacteroidales bacterium]|nr:hypothetical protein [Bacteroidales bacterium]
MTAHISVHEERPVNDQEAPLAFSMEGYDGQPTSSVIPFSGHRAGTLRRQLTNFR